MRITHLNITNFRGIRHFEVSDCAPAVFLLGANGAGKTCALDAIRAVLLGKVTDHRGKALKVAEWIGPSAKNAEVILSFEARGETFTAHMRVGKNVTLTIQRPNFPTWTGDPKDVRAALWKHLGVSQEHRACGLNPRSYLIGDDLGRMISDLGGGGVDKEQLNGILGEHGAWFHRFAKQEGITPDSRDNLLSIGAAMFRKRTELNAEAKRLDGEIAKLASVLPPANKDGALLGVDALPDLEKFIAQMNAERDQHIRELGAAQDAPDATEIARALEAARTERAALRYDPEKKQVEMQRRTLEEMSEARERAELDLNEKKTADSTAVYEESQASNALDKARRAQSIQIGSHCEACRQTITEDAAATYDAWVREQIQAAEQALAAASTCRQKTLAALGPLHTALETARKNEQTARMALDREEKAHADMVVRINALDARIESLSTPLAPHRPALEIEQDIAAIDTRIKKAQAAREALQAIATRQTLEQEREQCRGEIEYLAWAIPLFHSDKSNHASALNTLACNEQADFLARCNEKLEVFGVALGLDGEGKSLTVTFGPTDPAAPRVPVEQASDGEFLLAQWALATAFAGDGLVALDEVEKLDGDRRTIIFGALREEVSGGLWLSAAYGIPGQPDIDTIRAALDPVQVVWLENGHAADLMDAGEEAA